MELRQLYQFIALAEELHFHRAAKRLNMSQPPLTVAIKKLENEIGTELVIRDNKTVDLTLAGKVFLEHAYLTVHQAEKAIQITRETAKGIRGQLRIAYVGSTLYGKLPNVVRAFREQYPDIIIELLEATTTEQLALFKDNQIDLSILIPPLADNNQLQLFPFETDQLAIALPISHPLCCKPSISLTDLAHQSFVLWPAIKGPGFYNNIIELCLASGFTPNIIQQAQSMHTVLSLVAAGIGVSIVPASMNSFRNEDIRYCIINENLAQFELALCAPSPIKNPITEQFLIFNNNFIG